ncbi:HAD-IIB family hydrolase [Macrococcus carouselicus]|uniref:HAD-IIB family hydrolase n=1 Tax=Macrococcus carouselicus TaxID=69969 RepID=A0A9Q8FPU3_9STAP|nr:HAD-IIB family hydrolase [Macrococcus carouselicus]TDM02344.1 HAD-IIB family hydrolase [Macrococcus carouselicus]
MYFPEMIDTLVCSDFDETYFAHDRNNPDDVIALTEYLNQQDQLLFGIVSASTLTMIKGCLEEMAMAYPHFIAANSGTELYYYKDGREIYDTDYEQSLLNQGFSKTTIMELEQELMDEGIPLMIQMPFIHAPFSRNYYYRETRHETDQEKFSIIRKRAEAQNLSVNISRCNPLIGDPADCYDIDLFPESTGKDAIVRYLVRKYDIPFENTYAFGDSGNDIRMLNAVKHGYLVSNATEEAKLLHSKHAAHPYNKGILSILQTRSE